AQDRRPRCRRTYARNRDSKRGGVHRVNFGRKELLERRLTTLSKVMALISAAVGFAVLFGWIFGVHTLITISPGFATMKANTALAFFLSGVALWSLNPAIPANAPSPLRVKRAKLLSQVCAVIIALIGLLTLSEFLFGWDLGIDNLIIRDLHTLHTPHPGRMSPVSALGFVLLGAAFLMMDLETRSGKRPAQWLVLPVFLNSFVALLGYAYGVESLYR